MHWREDVRRWHARRAAWREFRPTQSGPETVRAVGSRPDFERQELQLTFDSVAAVSYATILFCFSLTA
jgi:hypothetical protein